MSPDLDTLSEIVLAANQWEQAAKPLDSLLADLMPRLQQTVAGLRGLTLYQQQGDQLILAASTEDKIPPILPITRLDDVSTKLTRGTDDIWRLAIRTDAQTLLLEATASAVADLTESAESLAWFGAFLLGVIDRMHNRPSRDQQNAVLSNILNAADFDELGQVVLQAMPGAITVVGITRFDPAVQAGVAPQRMTTDVVVTRDELYKPDVLDTFAGWDEAMMLSRMANLLNGNISIVDDIREREPESIMMVNTITYLRDLGAISYVTVGLRTGGRLLGLLVMGAPENVRLQQSQLDDVLAITDQIAIVLENRQLMQSTEAVLRETRLLYDLNQDLIASEDGIQVLQSLRKHLVPDAESLILVTFDWDTMTGELTSLVSDCWVGKGGREAQPQQQLIDNLSAEQIEDLKAEWQAQGRAVDIIEDLEAALPDRPALQHSYDNGVLGSVVIPIWDDQYIRQQITITFDQLRTFNESERRLLDASRNQIGIVLENQQLLRDTQRAAASLGNQVRVLQTINHLSARLSARQNEQALLAEVTEALHSTLGVDHVMIALRDKQQTQIVTDHPTRQIVGRVLPYLINEASEEQDMRQYILLKDLQSDLAADWQGLFDELGAKSVILLPLYDSRHGNLGVICLNSLQDDLKLDTGILNIAQTITAQVAVTLQNIRLLRSTQRQAQQLEQIAGFSEAIQVTLNTADLLEIALVSTPQIIVSDYISIAFYDNSRGELKLVAHQDSRDNTLVDVDNGPLLTDPTTTIHKVWKDRMPLQFNDLHADTELNHHARTDLRSVMTLPIFSRGTARGVMEIGSVKANMYTPVDGAVFQQLVSQLAVAVENAEAYTESQRLAKSKALASDISIQLQQQLTIEQILNVTMSELGRALGAKRGRIRLNPSTLTQENGTKSHDATE